MYNRQTQLCGLKFIRFHNPFRLTDAEVSDKLVGTRFVDWQTDCVIFKDKTEGTRQTELYFKRLKTKGGSLKDLCKRIEPHHASALLKELAPFYDFPLTIRTTLKDLCDE